MPRKSQNVVAHCGHLGVMSGFDGLSVSTGDKAIMTQSREMQTRSCMIYKDKYSGYSTGHSVEEKSGEFVDRKTGRVGYKEETKYTKSLKVNDKVSGSSTEYQAQVKFKEIHTPGPAKAKSNNYKGSGSRSISKSYIYY